MSSIDGRKRPATNGEAVQPDAKRPKSDGVPAANGTNGIPDKASLEALLAQKRAEISAKAAIMLKNAGSLASLSDSTTATPAQSSTVNAKNFSIPVDLADLQARINEARARVSASLTSAVTIGAIPGVTIDKTKRGLKADFFPGLDLTTGSLNLNNIRANIPKASFATTKANIRASAALEKPIAVTPVAEETKKELKMETPVIETDPLKNPYFDPSLAASVQPKMRARKAFHFVRPGQYVEEANKARANAQLELLKKTIAESVKKTGLETELELVSDLAIRKEPPPVVEWWDLPLLPSESYADVESGRYRQVFKEDSEIVSNLIHHPARLDPPAENTAPIVRPLMLTKKEQKKLRRQRRLEAQKEKMDKIRIGLLPPDAPKLRIANLMRVLGTEAVQDPTKVEATVRAQMKARQVNAAAHDAAQKLTDEQRKDKKRRKLQEDTSLSVDVAVFRINHLDNRQHKFKVDNNATQLHLTGCVIVYSGFCLVVVEGGPKGIKKYKKLLLRRIKWGDNGVGPVKDEEDDDEEEEEEDDGELDNISGKKGGNQCVLVWEGEVKQRAFERFVFFKAPTEGRAREILEPKQVMHYWDAAKNWVPEAM
ncbi:hypothetical protein SeLEV6574_g03406 [Synchytrium endobioticum]|uniref:Uncharacterized protein n=1 Tax=Synchytrium endobioticum TaxID=286115 RepID=A0A507D4E2_9FUNG|nr:hypothetical protein SeLEV6574_g03406 [Synchytrium endobioticum]